MPKFQSEAASVVESIVALVARIKAGDPEIATVLDAWDLRISFDSRERVLLIATVDGRGHARPLIALECDPANVDTFGAVGYPSPVRGLHDSVAPADAN